MTNGPSSLRSLRRPIRGRSALRNEIVTTRVLGASLQVTPRWRQLPNRSVFVEGVKPRRTVFRYLSAPEFQVTVTFEEEAGGETRLVRRMLFGSVEERKKVERFAVGANEQNLDPLEGHLAGIG